MPFTLGILAPAFVLFVASLATFNPQGKNELSATLFVVGVVWTLIVLRVLKRYWRTRIHLKARSDAGYVPRRGKISS